MTKFSVASALDDYIESVTDTREPDGKWHPSSMWGCNRQAIYQVRGTKTTEDTDILSKRRFYIGHRLHEAVQRAVESAKGVIECFPEFEVDVKDVNVSGHGDILLRLTDGTYLVIEVKSIKKSGMRMGLPKEQHKSQAMTYTWCLRHYGGRAMGSDGEWVVIPPLGESLRGMAIVYLEKEDLTIVEKFFPWEDEWNATMGEKLVELEMYKADPDSLPPRLPFNGTRKHWLCGYCAFYTKCWREDPAEIAPKGGF